MSASDVLKKIGEQNVKFLDLRFTDTRGKEQHLTIPTARIDGDFFERGMMFDGSSIAGWKGINESDMVLMPDTQTAVMDPFTDEATINITCDVLEPHTMQGYERDPRSVARRAEAYLKSTGIADTAFFGPEPEFFIFDDVRWGAGLSGSFVEIDSEEAHWRSGTAFDVGNKGHRPATFRCPRSTPCTTSAPQWCWRWRRWAWKWKCITMRSPLPVSVKSASSSTPWCARPTRSRCSSTWC